MWLRKWVEAVVLFVLRNDTMCLRIHPAYACIGAVACGVAMLTRVGDGVVQLYHHATQLSSHEPSEMHR